MSASGSNKNIKRPKKIFSLEERRSYCIEWQKSEMNQIEFCNSKGISRSAFYQWNKRFRMELKKDNRVGFSPVVLDEKLTAKQTDIIQLTIHFSNQIQLSIGLPAQCLVSFIQELGYAITTVR